MKLLVALVVAFALVVGLALGLATIVFGCARAHVKFLAVSGLPGAAGQIAIVVS